MNRDLMLDCVETQQQPFDVVIIGGGATGAGVAVDAASRNLSVLLLERDDFGSGTSSRSTKIVHGGVRYLAQGRIGLVKEALRERAYLLSNAPHIVAPLAFVVPLENGFEGAKYFAGLKLYDLLSGQHRLQASHWLAKKDFNAKFPHLSANKFCGAMRYFDAQFDDTRLLVNILETAVGAGALILNYAEVIALNKNNHGQIRAITFRDRESDKTFEIATRSVVNATGAASDELLKLDEPSHKQTILPSRGAHIVVKRHFLATQDALLMPRTPDGRIMFAIPWLDHLLIGTTDTPCDGKQRNPVPTEVEIEMILEVAGNYFDRAPGHDDILSSFAGIRPLVLVPSTSKTSKVSREHRIDVLKSGLISVSGGKWTTYRTMAEQCVDTLASSHNWSIPESPTASLKMHATPETRIYPQRFSEYGIHANKLEQLILDDPTMNDLLSKDLPYTKVHCVWAIRHEMARTVEDILARRTRALFLNKMAATEAAPKVVEILHQELGLDALGQRRQLEHFYELAQPPINR